MSRKLLLLFFSIAVIVGALGATVTLRDCATTECIMDAVTDTNSSHLLFFYDTLDVNSMRVYNTLTALQTQRKHVVDVLNIRDTQTQWLLSTFEVFYVPTLRFIKWTANGRKVLDGFQDMDFSPMSLAQYLDRH